MSCQIQCFAVVIVAVACIPFISMLIATPATTVELAIMAAAAALSDEQDEDGA